MYVRYTGDWNEDDITDTIHSLFTTGLTKYISLRVKT